MNHGNIPPRPAQRRRISQRTLSLLRSRVALAFRSMANGVDPVAAQRQATRFYRASGMPWASVLV
jgi:hypothetical protein